MSITNPDNRIEITYSWNLGIGTTLDASNNIVMSHSNASASIELADNQKLDTFGFRFEANELTQGEDNGVEIRFYDESMNIANSIEIYLPITDIGTVIQEIKIPIKAFRITMQLYGTWTCNHNNYIYGVTTSASIATKTQVGTVSVPTKGGLTVVEVDDQMSGAVAGQLSINCGDGVHVTQEGKLCITSDLSGNNWTALDIYESGDDIIGFIVNGTLAEDGGIIGGYHFEFLANGDIHYKNADRVIRNDTHTGSMPPYVPPVEGGQSNE